LNRTPITELVDGQSLDQVFQVGDKQLRANRDGGKYILLRLADRSGTIVGMHWNATDKTFESFERADYIHVQGRTQIHKGSLQIIVTSIEAVDADDIDLADFDRFDAAQSERLTGRLEELIQGLSNVHLRRLGKAFLEDADFVSRLKSAAAAVSNHHAYPGGLLRHTIDMIELAAMIGPRYPELDTEMLMFGAFLHDLGKIDELAADGEIAYTDRGQMIGHIIIGIQMLDEKIRSLTDEPFPNELRLHLEHLIASHHGQLEFGSPKIPLTLEAIALHHIDNLDAKLSSFTNIIRTDVSGDEKWTNFQPSIGRKLWKKINS
jgi:3'-5' exoribonuclease